MPTEAASGPELAASDFEYRLPPDLIAQVPAERRSGSRLLVLDRARGSIRHLVFPDFPGLLRDGDLIVVNDTRVFRARLMGRRSSGGMVEILLLRYPSGEGPFPCLVKPLRRIRDGESLVLEDGSVVEVRLGPGGPSLQSDAPELARAVERAGRVPLPPYIRRVAGEREEMDRERYQTVFARETGAVAAPTAGLHFEEATLEAIRGRGARVEAVTLHVGPGTFAPVREPNPRLHRMDREAYSVPGRTAEAILEARCRGGRVVAVGTTVVRALETAWDGKEVAAGSGETGLFILPGHRFRVVDALLTNFHLPRSTLLMLVCAFAGREAVLDAYTEAVERKYRFYSYGDAMFIQ